VAVTVLVGAARRALARDRPSPEEFSSARRTPPSRRSPSFAGSSQHPAPVLTDRSLADALTGLATACPVPCRIDADIPVRCAASVEATAYFVAAETLTNIAKHSQARTPPSRSAATMTGSTSRSPTTAMAGRTSARVRPRRHPPTYRSTRWDIHAGQPSRWTHHPHCEPAMRIVIAEDDPLLREASRCCCAPRHSMSWPPPQMPAFPGGHRRPQAGRRHRRRPDAADPHRRGDRRGGGGPATSAGLAVLVLSAYVEQAFATELLAHGSSGLGYMLKERVGESRSS